MAVSVSFRGAGTFTIEDLQSAMVTPCSSKIRSNQEAFRTCYGPEFIATALREWLQALDVRTLYIEPGSPWENGYCESFNSKLRDELLAREIFYDLREAQVLIENWRLFYNTARPHSSLGYKPPAPRTILPATFMPPYRLEAA
jgi:transposase InsO family protein